jgi:hypothetical protein
VSGGPRGGGVGIRVGGGWKKAAEWSETEAWAGARHRAVGLGAVADAGRQTRWGEKDRSRQSPHFPVQTITKLELL